MRVRTCTVLLLALLFAWPVAAQEKRGAIEGIVKDSSGAVLPGATVEAKSAVWRQPDIRRLIRTVSTAFPSSIQAGTKSPSRCPASRKRRARR